MKSSVVASRLFVLSQSRVNKTVRLLVYQLLYNMILEPLLRLSNEGSIDLLDLRTLEHDLALVSGAHLLL